jgi:hypothetical protein
MSVLTPGASIFVKAFRVAKLTEEGNIVAGAETIATKDGMKLTLTPVMETGADIVNKNANDDIAAMGKAGDKIKYFTVALELAKPDPALEAMCCGGTLVGSTAAALGEPSGLKVVPQETLGSLAKGTYGYRATLFNAFGETPAEADVSATAAATSPENMIVLSGVTMPSGALGVNIYGRTIGQEQFIGSILNIGSQTAGTILAKAVKANTPTKIKVTALTESIQKGTTFQITGDTNTPKVTFKVLAFAAKGTVELEVEANAEVLTEIKTAVIIPVLVDAGTVTPNGAFPTTDSTAGPGENVGYQAPELGPVANPAGVSIEAFSYSYLEGNPSPTQPFWWWAIPRVRYMHIQPRDLTNANTATIMEGQAFQNPNWEKGPSGYYPADTTKAWQRIRCGKQMVPATSYEPTLAVA